MEMADSALLEPGRLVTPSIRLVRELGHGGMGSVWIADHLSLRTQVAVKFLSERSLRVPDAVERFSLEAAAAARVRSAHVVQVFDYGVADDTPYIVMELLEGEDLARRLHRDRRLLPEQTIAIVTQLCKALDRAHAIGIVHRDIKPANVFLVAGLGDEPFVKMLDFGLAKHGGDAPTDLTTSRAVFGTLHYVSPEQAGSARAVTAQSDLWSVAVVAYECLTGARPYAAESVIELCAALNEARFQPATSIAPELPPAIDAWFARAFQRTPSERFGSANELASTLAIALAETSIEASGEATALAIAPAPPAPRRRNRALLWWIAAAGVVLAAALLASRAPDPPTSIARASASSATSSAPSSSASAAPSSDPLPTAIAIAATPSIRASTQSPSSAPIAATAARSAPRPSARAPLAASTAPPPSDDLFADPKR